MFNKHASSLGPSDLAEVSKCSAVVLVGDSEGDVTMADGLGAEGGAASAAASAAAASATSRTHMPPSSSSFAGAAAEGLGGDSGAAARRPKVASKAPTRGAGSGEIM
jgi:hypothetical protein